MTQTVGADAIRPPAPPEAGLPASQRWALERVLRNAWGPVMAGMYAVAPFLGITSLIMASGASRKIKRSSGQLTGLEIVGAAKVIAWLGAVLWIAAIVRVIGPMSAGL